MRKMILIAFFVAIHAIEACAQLPHTFTMVAKGGEIGAVGDVTVGSDGTVFSVDEYRGLSAYHFDGNKFIPLGRTSLPDDREPGYVSNPMDVEVMGNGTIIASSYFTGITAYRFEDGVFSILSKLELDGHTIGMTVDLQDRIYVARGTHGLAVYRLENDSFEEIHQVDTSVLKNCDDVAVAPDGTIHALSAYDEMRSYRWVDAILVEQTHTELLAGNMTRPRSVAVSPDGIVYIAIDHAGLAAYRAGNNGYELCGYVRVDNIHSVGIAADGKVLVAAGSTGLFVCLYDNGELRVTSSDNVGGWARATVTGPDGTLFLASYEGGLVAYGYDNGQLTRLAVTAVGGEALAVDVHDDGTVFLACARGGLQALRREDDTFSRVAYVNDGDWAEDVAVGSAGTVYLANRTNHKKCSGLRAYRFDGSVFRRTGRIPDSDTGAYAVTVSDSDHVFLAYGADGLYAFTHRDSTLMNTAHRDVGGIVNGIAVNSEHAVFFTAKWDYWEHGDVGLNSRHYDGFSFGAGAFVNVGDNPRGVAVGDDHTVYLVNGHLGLTAYAWNGHEFSERAHSDITGYTVTVGPDGTVFTGCGTLGLRAFQFTGSELINTAHIVTGSSVNKLAVGTDGLVYAALGREGVIAFRYSGTVGIDTPNHLLPTATRLEPVFPNPPNPTTTIQYTLQKPQIVSLVVTDLYGREVKRLLDGSFKEASSHQVQLNTAELPSGVYFYSLITGDQRLTKKMVVLR